MDKQLDPGRRQTLLAGGTVFFGSFLRQGDAQVGLLIVKGDGASHRTGTGTGTLPVKQIEDILRTGGKVNNGVLSIDQNRNDLDNVTGPGGLPWKPAFEIRNQLYFQMIGPNRAIFNGELSLLEQEINPVIDRIVHNRLQFQGLHQHFFDEHPQLWHIHVRGTGAPLALADAVANVVAATGTPLPQSSPAHPTSPLDAGMLGKILGGDAEVRAQGVVEVSVNRKNQIVLGAIAVKPELGVNHTIAFEPLGDGRAVVAPDFALVASEINAVMASQRRQGFTVHCLYNQETAESPQLYFSHQLAVGDAYVLAQAIRRSLENTNTAFS
ncbi:MAG: DUF1259 domain-containing protein [Telluria sp.]